MKKILFYKHEKTFSKLNKIQKLLIIFLFILLFFIVRFIIENNFILKIKNLLEDLQKCESNNNNILIEQIKLDYINNKFAIIRKNCSICGLFVIYNKFLGCIVYFIKKGYIPIVDLESFPNILNKFNNKSLNLNPWEYYFYQPYGYTLEGVKKNAKNIKYFDCKKYHKPYISTIYTNSL